MTGAATYISHLFDGLFGTGLDVGLEALPEEGEVGRGHLLRDRTHLVLDGR